MPKPQRNEKCHCNSNKKYKHCCLIKDTAEFEAQIEKYIQEQDGYSDNLRIFAEYLKEEYVNHKVINISSNLNADNYNLFQIKNYDKKTIMIAEKNEYNHEVFASHDISSDIIIMYRGSYRTFKNDGMMDVLDSIDEMIKTRLLGLEDK